MERKRRGNAGNLASWLVGGSAKAFPSLSFSFLFRLVRINLCIPSDNCVSSSSSSSSSFPRKKGNWPDDNLIGENFFLLVFISCEAEAVPNLVHVLCSTYLYKSVEKSCLLTKKMEARQIISLIKFTAYKHEVDNSFGKFSLCGVERQTPLLSSPPSSSSVLNHNKVLSASLPSTHPQGERERDPFHIATNICHRRSFFPPPPPVLPPNSLPVVFFGRSQKGGRRERRRRGL